MKRGAKNLVKRFAPGLVAPAVAVRARLATLARRAPSVVGVHARLARTRTLLARPLAHARPRLDVLKRKSAVAAGLAKTIGGTFRYWRAFTGSRGIANEWQKEAPHVVMLVVSDLRIDPRVLRSARALAGAGYRVTVMCPDLSTPPLREQPLDWGAGIEIRPLPWQAASYIMHFPWLFGDLMHEAAVAEQPFAFHCHDLTTAVVGLSAARRVGALCVCDFHEWYSENVSWNVEGQCWEPHPALKRNAYRLAERLALERADVVVANEARRDEARQSEDWTCEQGEELVDEIPLAAAPGKHVEHGLAEHEYTGDLHQPSGDGQQDDFNRHQAQRLARGAGGRRAVVSAIRRTSFTPVSFAPKSLATRATSWR